MTLKDKKPGDHVILRLKNQESPMIIDWMNRQSNLSDAIRYLIEEEIKAHDVRDLQEYIPAKRKPLQNHEKKHTVEENEQAQKSVEFEIEAEPARESAASEDVEERFAEGDEMHSTEGEKQETDHLQGKMKESQKQVEHEEDLSDELVDHWMNI